MPRLLAIVDFRNRNEERVLVRLDDDCATLPVVPGDVSEMKPRTGESCTAVEKSLHIPFELVYVRSMYRFPEKATAPGLQSLGDEGKDELHILEALIETVQDFERSAAPEGFMWISCRNPVLECTLRRFFEKFEKFEKYGLRGDESQLWTLYCAGWYRNVCEWIQSQLQLHLKGRPELVSDCRVKQVMQKGISCLLQAQTKCGAVFYFKGLSSTWMGDETVVTHALGELLPDDFERTIAVDAERKWVLMWNYGASLSHIQHMHWCEEINRDKNLAMIKEVLSHWSDVQIRSVAKTKKLTEAGLPKADRWWFVEKVADMADDAVWYEAQCIGGEERGLPRLSQEEYKRKVLSALEEIWSEVEKYKVPLALVHGDLNGENICADNEREMGEHTFRKYRFLDFAYTKICHPFVDAIYLFGFYNVELTEENLSSYLKPWEAYEGKKRLWDLVKLVYKLVHALDAMNLYFLYKTGDCGKKEWYRNEGLNYPLFYNLTVDQ